MPHFLINSDNIKDKIITDDKELMAHLTSFRIKSGEMIKFIDENEIVHLSRVEFFDKKKLIANVVEKYQSNRKLNFTLDCAVSILKPEAMHLAIENAVQAGAKNIYPIYGDNCAVKFNTIETKTQKWQKIALEAFKQCERADIPNVCPFTTYEELFKNYDEIIIFAEKYEQKTVSELNFKKDKILAVFGPEGGFSEREFDYFKSKNLPLVTLGNLIFKAPNAITAGLYGIVSNYDKR